MIENFKFLDIPRSIDVGTPYVGQSRLTSSTYVGMYVEHALKCLQGNAIGDMQNAFSDPFSPISKCSTFKLLQF